jgi:hypothetical protein
MFFRSEGEHASTKASYMAVSSYAYDMAGVEQKGYKNIFLNYVKPFKT